MFRVLALALLAVPILAGVYPNPVATDDHGEYVVLTAPADTDLGAYALTDGEATVSLPNVTVSGRIALTADPGIVRNLTDARVVAIPDGIHLSNAGEAVELLRNDTVVSRLQYGDAPEGELFANDTWTPLGATDFPALSTTDASVRAFVLPDDPSVPLDALSDAHSRLLLAGYTFSSERVARVLLAAASRGVAVRVLVEGGPVGGVTEREKRVLDELAAGGVTVRVLDGPHARYAYQHAKYAVADDRAVVTSENWKPGSIGGHATRGWGVVVHDEAVADRLAAVQTADSTWRDAVPWHEYERNTTFQPGERATATYPTRFPDSDVTADATVYVTPDDGHATVLDTVRNASARLLVQQVRIEDDRFLNATLAAARRGVRTRVLLSGAWYVRDDNRKLVRRLRRTARSEGLNLRARLVDPRGRFDHLHVKGVVTEDAALVGSLNWNHESVVDNREVMVALRGRTVAEFYARVFRADWRGGVWRLPLGALAVILVVLALTAALVRKRVSFSESARTGVRGRVPRPPSSR